MPTPVFFSFFLRSTVINGAHVLDRCFDGVKIIVRWRAISL
jgi:hypothetical protein